MRMTTLKLGRIAVLLVAVGAAAQSPSNAFFPKPIYSELPAYPELAQKARIVGNVKLRFVLDESGGVTKAETISGHPILSNPALGVVKSWKFRPGTLRSNVRYETEFIYELKVQLKPGEPKLMVSMTDFRRVEIVSEIYAEPIE
jgi:TonB family protein